MSASDLCDVCCFGIFVNPAESVIRFPVKYLGQKEVLDPKSESHESHVLYIVYTYITL